MVVRKGGDKGEPGGLGTVLFNAATGDEGEVFFMAYVPVVSLSLCLTVCSFSCQLRLIVEESSEALRR